MLCCFFTYLNIWILSLFWSIISMFFNIISFLLSISFIVSKYHFKLSHNWTMPLYVILLFTDIAIISTSNKQLSCYFKIPANRIWRSWSWFQGWRWWRKMKVVSQGASGKKIMWEMRVNRPISWSDLERIPQAPVSFLIRSTHRTGYLLVVWQGG